MNATRLDMHNYPRMAHFEYFRSLRDPYVGVTVNVDVTEAVAFCKRKPCSFYLTFLHLASIAANRVPEFRQRILDDGIVEFDNCPSSHIELLENGAYCYCTLRHDPEQPLDAYLAYAETARQACRKNASIEEDEDVLSEFFISTLPWLHYTDLKQPTGGDESNPRISWGRFETDWRGRLMMPVTVLAHHALVDGVHIARFYANLQEELKQCRLQPTTVRNI